jgi:antitoxin component of RelBE/YafQ-DinJ toxin-antitoxin module
MHLEEIKTEIMNLPIESQWQLLEDLIKNLRMRSEQNQDLLFDTRIPNAETLKTIEEAEKGINLIECSDADDLFRKLGI